MSNLGGGESMSIAAVYRCLEMEEWLSSSQARSMCALLSPQGADEDLPESSKSKIALLKSSNRQQGCRVDQQVQQVQHLVQEWRSSSRANPMPM